MGGWSKGFAALVFASILAIPSLANGPANSFIPVQHKRVRRLNQIWHYIVTHKEVLAADAIAASAWSADSASTVYDQHHCVCVETNPFLGKRPSEGAVWGYGIGAAAVQISLNHLIWHYSPHHSDRHLIWFEMAPLIAVETSNVYSNVRAADIAPIGQQSSDTRVAYGLPAATSRFSVPQIDKLSVPGGQGNRLAAFRQAARPANGVH